MTNPLVADRPGFLAKNDSWDNVTDCIPIVGNAVDAVNGFSQGSTAEVAMGVVGTALDTASMLLDPIGTLASSIAGFLLTYIPPLPGMLDSLTGDPEDVRASATTWANISEQAGVAFQKLDGTVTAIDSWTGDAADAYRAATVAIRAVVETLSGNASAVSSALGIAGAIVELVQTIVKTIISELVGKFISWAAELAGTLGLAAPIVVTQATTAVGRYVNKVTEWIDRMLKTLYKLDGLAKGLRESLENLAPALKTVLAFLDTKVYAGTDDLRDPINIFRMNYADIANWAMGLVKADATFFDSLSGEQS